MSRTPVILAISMVLVSTLAAAPSDAQGFIATKWVVVNSLAEVEPAIISSLRSRMVHDNRLADAGQPFEATDIITGDPIHRFILGGHAGPYWFVLYEHGGRGHHLVLAVFEAGSPSSKLLLFARGDAGVHNDLRGWRVDLPALRRLIEIE